MYLVLLREELSSASVNCSSLLIEMEFLNVDMQQNSILPLFLRPNPYGLILGHRPTPSLSFWLFLSQNFKKFSKTKRVKLLVKYAPRKLQVIGTKHERQLLPNSVFTFLKNFNV